MGNILEMAREIWSGDVINGSQIDNVSAQYFNRRVLSRNAKTYELEKFTKNKMLIFKLEIVPGEMTREGTDKDVAALTACFKERAFEVQYFYEWSHDTLLDDLKNEINQELSDYGCFAVVLLTQVDSIFTPAYCVSKIVDVLKASSAPGLLTKPKILIMQIGEYYNPLRAFDVFEYLGLNSKNYPFPTIGELDFLIIRDIYPRILMDRAPKYGTWFIQYLCKIISESKPNENVLDILKRVQPNISVGHEDSCFTAEDKQIPVVTTTLTRSLCLNSCVNVTVKRSDSRIETTPHTTPLNNSRKLENVEEPIILRKKTLKRKDSSEKSPEGPSVRGINVPAKCFNRRFLDQNARTYELENFTMNKMLIFNQENCPGEIPRAGTDKDVAALKTCFEKRAFEVECFHDCTRDELFDNLENAINQDLSDYGCFAVAILTHGSHDGLLMTKDRPFYESQIVDALKGSNAPSLLTKPKILIIQACRGDGVSRASRVGQIPKAAPYQHDSWSGKNYSYTMAEESDFLIIYSTFPGMVAHRGPNDGSWFIQSLCKFLNKSQPYENLSDVLERVRRDVSINYTNSSFTAEDKQIPVVTTTLTRTLSLNSGVNFAKKHPDHRIETALHRTLSRNAGKLGNVGQSEHVEPNNLNDEEMEIS